MMNTRILLSALSFLALSLSSSADKKPDWAKNLSSPRFGKHPVIEPVKLRFELSWKGTVQAGVLRFEMNKPDKRYPQYHISQIYGGSTGFASTLFPYRGNFVSFLRKKSLYPVHFVSEETDKREYMKTTNLYNRSRMTTKEEIYPLAKHKKNSVEKDTFKWPFIFDAVSSMYYIRSQKLKKGDVLRFVMHPFHSPYLATVTVLDRENHNGKPAIKLDLKLRKIRKDFTLKEYKKMTKATLWLSDDKLRIPLELRSAVFIGDVRMVLTNTEKL